MLRNALPQEVVYKLAGIVHQGVCLANDEADEMDEEEHIDCIAQDADVVKELLDVLDQEGVSYNTLFVPYRKVNE